MIEPTKCNCCTLKMIRRRYKGHKIKLEVDGDWTMCLVDGHAVAQFLELTDKCACG